jgi:2-dehydropantoate 2-reductase
MQINASSRRILQIDRPVRRFATTVRIDVMKVLVYGAGIIGTLYAARLKGSGHQVTVLARGQRLADIHRYGLVLDDILTGVRSVSVVNTIAGLDPDDQYDLALITVRRDQLASTMPELEANRNIPILLFMLNNPIGSISLSEKLGARVMLGFPGAGGTREGHSVRYAMIAQQPTMLGEPDGTESSRLHTVTKAFRVSGFKTRTARDMDGWLKAHAFFVTAVSGAIYLAGGSPRRLSEDTKTLQLMAQGVSEGFAAVRALGHTVTPFALRVLFTWLPSTFAVHYWRSFFATEMAEYVFGRHARAAFAEMRDVANDCRIMLEQAGGEAPALGRLYAEIDRYSGRQ